MWLPAGSTTPEQVSPIMTSVALQLGQNLVDQGKGVIDREFGKTTTQLKHYFSVDTNYVMKKLQLIFFPFIHKNWAVSNSAQVSVEPINDINAPDLYIPLMAFLTYLLVGAFSQGIQGNFIPHVFCAHANIALICSIIQVFIWMAIITLARRTITLSTFDVVAYCCYNYFPMIVTVLVSCITPLAYFPALAYLSLAIMFFLYQSLKTRMVATSGPHFEHIFFVIQPFLIWYLTRKLV